MNRKEALVALEGVLVDSKFWVNVTAQVSNRVSREWRGMSVNHKRGKNVTLTVPARATSQVLSIDMDVFQPAIGKFKFGKISLRTGEVI